MHMHPLADDKRCMKSKRCDEITWLKLPSSERTVNDFESKRQPIHGFERSGSIETFHSDRLLHAKDNLRFDLQRTGMCKRQRGGVAVAVVHCVVVHMGPNQGFKFEHAPHRLIGITNLAADCSVSSRFPAPLECCFNLICRVEIETGA